MKVKSIKLVIRTTRFLSLIKNLNGFGDCIITLMKNEKLKKVMILCHRSKIIS
jgi:hypothetical protein